MLEGLLSPSHLIIILIIALVVLGPKRLPEVARSVGKGVREFRTAISFDDNDEEREQLRDPEGPRPAESHDA